VAPSAGAVRRHVRGWEVVQLRSEYLSLDLVPGKGGDIISLRVRDTDTELLWQSPWGLRHRGEAPMIGSSEALLMEAYPGGWQTVFPNGGAAVEEQSVLWGMHGEAWLAPFDCVLVEDAVAVLTTRLVRSPFRVVKRVEIAGRSVVVTEEVTNEGATAIDVMWGQHPAFGAPLISAAAVIETGARGAVVETAGSTPETAVDYVLQQWPVVELAGATQDLRRVPGPQAGQSRLVYLSDFDEAWASITNTQLGLQVRLEWDLQEFPYAWYWLEAGGRQAFPWFGSAYVLALEPASSWPAAGVARVRDTTRTHLSVPPGATRTAAVTVTVNNI
jgi:galactose mutarotase-like enzyme